MNLYNITYGLMQSLFTQTIAQFAPLRAFARMPLQDDHACNIRALFPKAFFDEKAATREMLFEIAWSFLSQCSAGRFHIGLYLHRAGGLPAIVGGKYREWYRWCKRCRTEKDPRTGLSFPTVVCVEDMLYMWFAGDEPHRTEKDPRTGYILPAIIEMRKGRYEWRQNGRLHRKRKDPITGEILPAIIYEDGRREVWIYGQNPYDGETVIGFDRPYSFDNES